MAPPQVIISQPQPAPQQDNSLLSYFITSKLLNESNILNSRTNMTAMEQPTTRGEPSYFNARESIIPKMPDLMYKAQSFEIDASQELAQFIPLKQTFQVDKERRCVMKEDTHRVSPTASRAVG